MKKWMAFALALALVLALASCGKKDFDRTEDGYLTEEAAKTVAAADAGYALDEVVFEKAELTGSGETAKYELAFNDNVVDYTYTVDANTGAVLASGGK